MNTKVEKPVCTLDACVIYPVPVRDLLLNLAEKDLFSPRWTHEIHEESKRNLLRNREDLTPQQLDRTEKLMNNSFDESLVEGYESFIESLEMPDPDDRHVLACAIKSCSDIIITSNSKDFPRDDIYEKYGIEVLTPDEFVIGMMESDVDSVLDAFNTQVSNLRKPAMSPEQVLNTFEKIDVLKETAIRIRQYIDRSEENENKSKN